LSLRARELLPELMDCPTLAPAHLEVALRGLERINWWSRSAGILWKPIQRLAREASPRPLRVLDIATGGGDVPIALWRKARRVGIALRIDGCDVNPRAVAYATRRAEAHGADVRFFVLNALEEPLPSGYDAIVCSLFFHHLRDEIACWMLARMAEAAGRMIGINDLLRSRSGLALASGGGVLLSRSAVVHADAPQSVRAAFTIEEMARLAIAAGLPDFQLRRRWPCRYFFEWTRP